MSPKIFMVTFHIAIDSLPIVFDDFNRTKITKLFRTYFFYTSKIKGSPFKLTHVSEFELRPSTLKVLCMFEHVNYRRLISYLIDKENMLKIFKVSNMYETYTNLKIDIFPLALKLVKYTHLLINVQWYLMPHNLIEPNPRTEPNVEPHVGPYVEPHVEPHVEPSIPSISPSITPGQSVGPSSTLNDVSLEMDYYNFNFEIGAEDKFTLSDYELKNDKSVEINFVDFFTQNNFPIEHLQTTLKILNLTKNSQLIKKFEDSVQTYSKLKKMVN